MLQPLPLQLGPIAEVELDSYRPKLVDVIIDKNGYVHKRPGLLAFSSLTSASDGVLDLFYWQTPNLLVAKTGNTGSDLYTISVSGTATARGDTGGRGGQGMSFVDWGYIGSDAALYVCNSNGESYQLINDWTLTQITDGDFPSNQYNITVLDRYLIATQAGTGNFHWSDVADGMTWSANYAEAESRPDRIVWAEGELQRLFLFGRKSIEIWYDDGVTPFVRSPQGVIPVGVEWTFKTVAWVPEHNTFYFLSPNSKLMRMEGINAVEVSPEFTKRMSIYIPNYTRLDYFNMDGKPYLALKPSGQTEIVIYDLTTGLFYEWYKWGGSSYGQFDGISFVNPAWTAAKTNLFVGSYTGNSVYRMYNGLKDDNGTTIRSLIRTPAVDRGEPGVNKRCNFLQFNIRRTEDVVTGNPTSISVSVRYRDDGSKTWTTARTITLISSTETADDTEFIAEDYMWGQYKIRQWEIAITDSVPCCITSIKEDYDILY